MTTGGESTFAPVKAEIEAEEAKKGKGEVLFALRMGKSSRRSSRRRRSDASESESASEYESESDSRDSSHNRRSSKRRDRSSGSTSRSRSRRRESDDSEGSDYDRGKKRKSSRDITDEEIAAYMAKRAQKKVSESPYFLIWALFWAKLLVQIFFLGLWIALGYASGEKVEISDRGWLL